MFSSLYRDTLAHWEITLCFHTVSWSYAAHLRLSAASVHQCQYYLIWAASICDVYTHTPLLGCLVNDDNDENDDDSRDDIVIIILTIIIIIIILSCIM